jgi:hypothetical protein
MEKTFIILLVGMLVSLGYGNTGVSTEHSGVITSEETNCSLGDSGPQEEYCIHIV